MRTIWKGTISFGLVSIGIKLSAATEEKDIKFHQVHAADGGRIKYKRTCSGCGKEVNYGEIAKGCAIEGGEPVVLTDEDFAGLPLATSRVIDVIEFVPAEQIDPILYGKAYYLAPAEKANTKSYVLLRDALIASGRVAVAKVALRQREHLATLRVHEGVLLLNTMLWPDEVRAPAFEFLKEEVDVRPQELAMAGSLIESMVGQFDPAEHTDNYRAALQELLDAKAGGQEVVQPVKVADVEPVADLFAALKASVERSRANRERLKEPTPITAARSVREKAKQKAA